MDIIVVESGLFDQWPMNITIDIINGYHYDIYVTTDNSIGESPLIWPMLYPHDYHHDITMKITIDITYIVISAWYHRDITMLSPLI